MYDDIKFDTNDVRYEPEDQTDEGRITLGICAIIGICIVVVLWTPNVEAIGSWVYAHFFSA